MNKHMEAQGTMVDSLGKQMKPRPDVRAEGAYSLVRMVRVAVSEIDGSEMYGKARLVMGKDGKPERLEIRGGLLPLGNVLIAQSGSAAYLLTLEKDGNDFKMKPRVSGDGMTLVCEFSLSSAMQIKGNQRVKEDPMSWGDVCGEQHLEEIVACLEGRVQELTDKQLLRATFVFRDKTGITGAELFGRSVELSTGHIKFDYAGGEFRADVLKAENAERTVRLILIQRNVEELPDIEGRFAGAERKPLAFKAEIDGYVYAGVMF